MNPHHFQDKKGFSLEFPTFFISPFVIHSFPLTWISSFLYSLAMKKQNEKNMIHIGNILSQSLKACRSQGDGDMLRIWEIWDSAVGDTIAQNTRPAAFKGHLLQVNVSSSSWLYHLNFLKKELMGKINTALGSPLVRELNFKIGKTTP